VRRQTYLNKWATKVHLDTSDSESDLERDTGPIQQFSDDEQHTPRKPRASKKKPNQPLDLCQSIDIPRGSKQMNDAVEGGQPTEGLTEVMEKGVVMNLLHELKDHEVPLGWE
jgi:hypothetical protein